VTDSFLVTEIRERVLHVLINRAQKRNALSRSLLAEIEKTFVTHSADDNLVAAVITGAGDRCFAAGGDLSDLNDLRKEEDGRTMALGARAALDAVRAFPVPVIAALNGDALGGGAELAAACDFRVAAPTARIGFIQGRLAISTAWGGGIDLIEILGRRRALRLLSTAEIIPTPEALSLGLVDAVATEGQSLDAAVEDFIAPMRVIAPQAQRAFKALSRAGGDRTRANTIEVENFARCWGHPDHWAAHDRMMNRQAAK